MSTLINHEFRKRLFTKVADPRTLTKQEVAVLTDILHAEADTVPTGSLTVIEPTKSQAEVMSVVLLDFLEDGIIHQEYVQQFIGYIYALSHAIATSNQLIDDGYSLNPLNETNYKPYVGGFVTRAVPMTRGNYNDHKGWRHPMDEDPNDKGMYYKQANGAMSWMVLESFKDTFRGDGDMTYGDALILLKEGERLMRAGWNGSNMFVEIDSDNRFENITVNNKTVTVERTQSFRLVNLNKETSSSWHASVPDSLAEDWSVFPEEE